MTDTSVFLFINGLAGKMTFFDAFFKGVANDYFPLVLTCLLLVWLWFGTRDRRRRMDNQRAVITAIVAVGLTAVFMVLMNHYYFRVRPFNALPPESVNLLFYPPHDSSFPSNFAAVIFALAWPVFFKNKACGICLISLAAITSFGRIYLGIHYPLDILAGLAVGSLGALAAYLLSRNLAPLLDLLLDRLQRIYLA